MSQLEHILLVEDDASLAEWIFDYLTGRGYQVTIADRGDTAVELIREDCPSLVILDLMLPGKNGFDVCKEVRSFYSGPILMMTACDEEADEVLGLELGANDYVAKPIKPRVLLARINVLLRGRTEFLEKSHEQYRYGSFLIDQKSKSVSVNSVAIDISTNEFDVLWVLVSQAGSVVGRAELVSQLRGIDYDGFDRSIDVRISRLRKKLGDDSAKPFKIKTIWGKGYLFAVDAW